MSFIRRTQAIIAVLTLLGCLAMQQGIPSGSSIQSEVSKSGKSRVGWTNPGFEPVLDKSKENIFIEVDGRRAGDQIEVVVTLVNNSGDPIAVPPLEPRYTRLLWRYRDRSDAMDRPPFRVKRVLTQAIAADKLLKLPAASKLSLCYWVDVNDLDIDWDRLEVSAALICNVGDFDESEFVQYQGEWSSVSGPGEK